MIFCMNQETIEKRSLVNRSARCIIECWVSLKHEMNHYGAHLRRSSNNLPLFADHLWFTRQGRIYDFVVCEIFSPLIPSCPESSHVS